MNHPAMPSSIRRTRVASSIILAALASLPLAGPARADDHSADECLHSRLESLAAPGSPVLRFDDATGRNTKNYPPPPLVEYRNLDLKLLITDMNQARLSATCIHTLAPIVGALPSLRLRCGPRESMQIQGVSVAPDEGVVTFTHDGEFLDITFDPPLTLGKEYRLSIDYDLIDPPEGLIWTPESPAWPNRPAQIHTQGEPESNHYWFPCHDFPNVRATQTMSVQVPDGYVASANGAPAGQETLNGHTTFTWRLDKPHVPYLAALVVGKFDIGTLQPPKSGTPLQVYAPVGKGPLIQQTFGRTGEMIDTFAAFTGHAYAWPRYAQLIVHNFNNGGMENTSVTTLYDTAILDQTALLDQDLDGLISHELAHQWFGDLATCNSWEHIWLNEGFATYMSHVWFQHRDGDDAYYSALFETRRGLIGADSSDPAPAPNTPAMCSKEYKHPWEVFRRGANPYPKGAFILHMLRMQLGDETFRAGVKLYLDRFSFKTAETRDLRLAFEEVSGRSLERFFQQWCFRPGVPHVAISTSWDDSSHTLTLSAQQTQPLDGYNPAFDLPIPVWIQTPGSSTPVKTQITIDTREASTKVQLLASPTFVCVDPQASVLADLRVTQSREQWFAQLKVVTTAPGFLQAADAITSSHKLDDPIGGLAPSAEFARIASDTTRPVFMRNAAISALRKLHATPQLLALLKAGIADARVRNTALAELAQLAVADAAASPPRDSTDPSLRENTLALLRSAAASEPSYACRSTALRALGEMRDAESVPFIQEATRAESQHDQVRQAAVDALASLDRIDTFDAIAAAAAPGIPTRTRPGAVKAAARLYHHDPDRVFALLCSSLADREVRTRQAAGEALAALGEERARGPLQAATAHPSVTQQAAAAGWLKDLDANIAAKAAAAAPPTPPKPTPSTKSSVKPGRGPRHGWTAPKPLPVGG